MAHVVHYPLIEKHLKKLRGSSCLKIDSVPSSKVANVFRAGPYVVFYTEQA